MEEKENLQQEDTNKDTKKEKKQDVKEKSNNDLKNETINTVKEVKESVKNINIKEEAEKGKGYLKELIKDPIKKINDIANDKENKHFKTAILLLIIWTAVVLIKALIAYNASFSYMMKHILDIIKITIAPIVSILVLTLIVFLLNKENKKSLNTVITTIVTVKLPIILSSVIGLITLISKSAYKIVNPISLFLEVISIVLVFFGIKKLFDVKEDNKAIQKFALVLGIYYIVEFVLTFLEISI